MIKEMLFEEEEDKGDRERKFRWKNLDAANMSELVVAGDGDDVAAHDSDEENEEEWRRRRFEREQLLKQSTEMNETAETVGKN